VKRILESMEKHNYKR